MKKILAIILFCLCLRSEAQTVISATINVTNLSGTITNETITVNGNLRYWTNVITAPAVQILTNGSIATAASNLYNAFVVSPVPLANVFTNSTNGIILRGFPGQPMTVTISPNWGTVVTTTLTPTNTTAVRVPYTNLGLVERTNVESGLVGLLNDTMGTNSITNISPYFTNFPALANTNFFTASNIFSGVTVISNTGNYHFGGIITNVTLQQVGGSLSNNTIVNPIMTNGQNYGAPFRSPGGGTGSEQFGIGALATTNTSVAFGDLALATNISTTAIGYQTIASGQAASAFGVGSIASNLQSISIGGSVAGGQNSIAIGSGALATNDNSIAYGFHAATTTSHQIALGTASESVWIPGPLEVDGVVSNATFAGSVTLQNELIYNQKSISIVNGNNTLDPGTNTYILLSGPTASATLASIKSGFPGRVLTVQYNTNLGLTIANESGFDGTATNHIRTGQSADVSFTNNPTVVDFIYDPSLSRWVEKSHN